MCRSVMENHRLREVFFSVFTARIVYAPFFKLDIAKLQEVRKIFAV